MTMFYIFSEVLFIFGFIFISMSVPTETRKASWPSVAFISILYFGSIFTIWINDLISISLSNVIYWASFYGICGLVFSILMSFVAVFKFSKSFKEAFTNFKRNGMNEKHLKNLWIKYTSSYISNGTPNSSFKIFLNNINVNVNTYFDNLSDQQKWALNIFFNTDPLYGVKYFEIIKDVFVIDNSTKFNITFNKNEIARWMVTWFIWWPFYLFNLIVGDIIYNVSNCISSMVGLIFSKLVQKLIN